MNRRFFILAAPAIVAAPSLMKVSALAIQKTVKWLDMRVSNRFLYGVGIYSGYDGYVITPSDWEQVAQDLMRGAA